ncbi:hypothetical protein [Psychrobacter jeotgali]|uniref:hypothetical protein n=1 Tax=Psychrobacter jeotgali TaxID=179010 RepID=UPI00191B6A04|nr:hypothetical protein [Psychrobacter jeotgali]
MLLLTTAQLSSPKSLSSVTDADSKPVFKKRLERNTDRRFILKKAKAMALILAIAGLSFSAVGCATLNALEPTAVLISDMKDIL